MNSAADSAALRFGVRAPQGMRCMRLREGIFSPLLEDPPPSREGRSLLALLGGFLDALMVAAWSVNRHRFSTMDVSYLAWCCFANCTHIAQLPATACTEAQRSQRIFSLGMTLDRQTDRLTQSVPCVVDNCKVSHGQTGQKATAT